MNVQGARDARDGVVVFWRSLDWSGPTRRTWIGSGLAAVFAGLLIGTVLGILSPANTAIAGSIQSTVPLPTAPDPATVGASPAHGASATPSPAQSPSPSESGSAAVAYVTEPWTDASLQFGVLNTVRLEGGGASIRVQLARFLTGDEAAAYHRRHHGSDPNYAVADVARHTVGLTVDPGAALFSNYRLGDNRNINPAALTLDQLEARMKAAAKQHHRVYVWVKHQDGNPTGDAPVVYLAEQYVPKA